jgi:hypothetical protein
MKSSSDRDNNYDICHNNVIQRIAGFAITLNYHHPVECVLWLCSFLGRR